MIENPGLNRKTQVLVVDDHPIVREGVRHQIETQPDMVVCCEVGRASDAVTFLHKSPVDIAIVDIILEGRSGIDLIKQIRASKFDFPILVLTIHDEVTYAQRVLAAGAQGYLVKSEPPGLIIDALRRLLTGEFFISRSMASKIFARIGDPGGIDSGVANLSDRELEVLEAVGRTAPLSWQPMRRHGPTAEKATDLIPDAPFELRAHTKSATQYVAESATT